MRKEINQEARFSVLPREASFAGRHLNAESPLSLERERVFAETHASDVPAAQFATSDPHIIQLGAKDGKDLRVRASSGSKTAVWLDVLMFGAAGLVAGYLLSGGNPVAGVVGVVLGALFGAVLAWATNRARR